MTPTVPRLITGHSPKSKAPIRRRVRRDYSTGTQIGFRTKSFTKNDGTEYHPVIDVQTGEFTCDCPDHVYRHRACKHILRAAAQLQSELKSPSPSVPHCFCCQDTGNLLLVIEDDGRKTGSHLCRECAKDLRAVNESWSAEEVEWQRRITLCNHRRDDLLADIARWPELDGLRRELVQLDGHIAELWYFYLQCDAIYEGGDVL